MRWRDGRRSDNVEDRRRLTPGTVMVGGGAGSLLIVIVALLFGVDPQALLQQAGNNPGPVVAQGDPGPGGDGAEEANDEGKQFVEAVLAETEDVWNRLFANMGKQYREPKLVLFSRQVESACGIATAAVGPFYCPGDEKVYIDLAFYDDLRTKFRAPGEFAQAYVIAHEIGHHVQNQLGITAKMQRMQGRISKEDYNQLSVRLELQADFLAGVWANHAHKEKQILEAGDIESALNAASAIGDDRLQRESQGYVVPDSFTHGTSAQRARWFRRGFETGDINQGDTFEAKNL